MAEMNLVAGLIGAGAVIVLAGAVHTRLFDRLDRRVFQFVRGLIPSSQSKAGKKRDTMMRDITAIGGDVFSSLVLISGAAYLWSTSDIKTLTAFVALMAGARVVGLALKKLISRARPPASDQTLEIFTSSFPSIHTAMGFVSSFAIAAFMVGGTGQLGTALAVGAGVSAMIGVTRLYFGVHWPLDVLAGWLLGLSACSLAMYWLPTYGLIV